MTENGLRDPEKGRLRATQKEIRKLPAKGKVKTYILTSAQNSTGLHEACWSSLQALAAYDSAELLAGATLYDTKSRASAGQKRKAGAGQAEIDNEWDPRIVPHLANRSIELAPGLVWCGELQILPTAVNPVSGLESYTGRASSIIPHAKFAVQSIPSPKHQGAKFIYTTGTVTLRNYIQKKAGQKAEFHHGYGGLIVEVRHDGTWFVRQLNADSEGVIYDLDRRIMDSRVSTGHRPEALVWGDIHTRHLETDIRELGWGRGGVLDTLRPRRQVMHDVLDFRSQNHHDRKDPWKAFAKHCAESADVEAEVSELAVFLGEACRPWCETAVAAANHDEAMTRWLKEVDFREDPRNAEFILAATTASYSAIREGDDGFHPVEWAVARQVGKCKRKKLKWLRRDEEYLVCVDASGGIELGMHGDVGSNGARGGLAQYAKTGRKCIVGHSHSAGLQDGAMQVGVMGALEQGYNIGQSSWSHTFALVYPNGKRTLVTVWANRWHGHG